uniref:Uncharacterized protein n=1 Tax=Arundo donax TaxID=35708 RepID=A0A0A8YPM9_ARUDO
MGPERWAKVIWLNSSPASMLRRRRRRRIKRREGETTGKRSRWGSAAVSRSGVRASSARLVAARRVLEGWR